LFLSFLLMTTGVWDAGECSSGDGKTLWYESLNQNDFLPRVFPKGFLWGVGTAAFPTEGSWDQDGKGQSIWDHFTHHNVGTANMTADTASNSYVLWEKDIESLRYLGVNFYSFSISWPRIFPDGDATGKPNLAAVEHYQQLIDRLKALDLEPVVTLFHWDLPQILQEELGGWKNAKLVQIFGDYATFCFKTFGQDVRYWITVHNPLIIAFLGYGTGIHAPGVSGDLADPFIVAHNLIRAHANAWHIYDKHFRPHQHGQISITLGSYWVEPFKAQATPVNVELCQKSMEAVIGWFAEPIYGNGDYPSSLRSSYLALVPNFTPEEKLWVRGTADFFSLALGPDSVRAGRVWANFGQTGALNLRKILGWIQKEYEDPSVLVAESSWFSDASVGVEDTVAIYIMKNFINQVLQAVVVDHVKVFGYTAWSLVDGFEWNSGYSIRRGLFYINFNQPERSRVPKTTAQYYRQIIKNNGFLDETEPDIDGHFPCDFQFGVADFILQVQLQPFSPQFTDPVPYRWNFSGDGSLHPVSGVTLRTRGSQCTDFLAIKKQIRLLEVTGSTHYRFALDWPQLFPNGDILSADAATVRYYRCMLTELQKKGIRVAVTLYHPSFRSHTLGLPRLLHAQGGWINASTSDAFVDYATFCFKNFGSFVDVWITVNEPNRLTEAYKVSADERDAVVRNVLMAHARAWNIYHTRFRTQQGATISFALHADWVEPANPFVDSNAHAVQHFLFFELGRFLDPILQEENYIDANSCLDCFRVPYFSDDERSELRGTLDFIALNHFTTRLVYPKLRQDPESSSFIHDYDCSFMTDPTWASSNKGQALVPWGLRRVLWWVKNRYGNSHPVIITATGIDDQASHNDYLRQRYIKSYMQEALKARELDGVDVRGFYIWKLQDHHAPDYGFFLSSLHRSQPKASVSVYRQLISQGGFPSISDPGTSPCESSVSQTECWICKNKPFLFFGTCVTISLSVLAGIMVTGMMKRRRRKSRMKAR
ncbi:beta-klotho, partial [Silurus asotus]